MHFNIMNITQKIKKCVAAGLGVMVATAAMTGGYNNTEVQAAENVVVVIDPGHELKGQSIKDKILFIPGGKGSTVGSYVIFQMKKKPSLQLVTTRLP